MLINFIKLYTKNNHLYFNKLFLICLFYSLQTPYNILPINKSKEIKKQSFTKKFLLIALIVSLIKFTPINTFIKDIVIIGIILLGYSKIQKMNRTNKNDNIVSKKAYDNALYIIDKEKKLGIYNELSIQKYFLSNKWFIKIMNFYYGAAHVIITSVILILLYTKQTNNYKFWRYCFYIMNGLSFIIYRLYPMMPPRLLDEPCPTDGGLGGNCFNTENKFGFIDTIKMHGGPLNFSKGVAKDVSNQYAAMPSLHIGFAIWCTFALFQFIQNPWIRTSLFIYPIITTLNIIITANHFWLDGVVGIIVFFIAYLIIKYIIL